MISTALLGRLGNTMFQIAATIGTASRLNTVYAIPALWEYKDMFNGPFNLTDVKLERYIEPAFHYNEITKDNIELYGYWQSIKYFENCQDDIRRLFAPAQKVKEQIKWRYGGLLKKNNTCSLHVRRTDYLELSEYHYNLEVEYYTTIMKMFPYFHFVCFSDSIEWCKANIPAQEFISDSLAVDFHLMSMMDNHIIANSSFSWWASWLNPAKDKMIFAPPKNCWFGPKKSHLCVDDLYCDNWLYER